MSALTQTQEAQSKTQNGGCPNSLLFNTLVTQTSDANISEIMVTKPQSHPYLSKLKIKLYIT